MNDHLEHRMLNTDTLKEQLDAILRSFSFFVPELILSAGILVLLTAGLLAKKNKRFVHVLVLMFFLTSLIAVLVNWSLYATPHVLFNGMLRSDDFSAFFKILFNTAGIFTTIMTWFNSRSEPQRSAHSIAAESESSYNRFQKHLTEYYALLTAIVLGAQLLVMSKNFVMVFLSLELVSISSYVITGFAFSKQSTEGSLKYFLFGSVASAVMLYGISFLYGLTHTLDFMSNDFVNALVHTSTPLMFFAGFMVLAGFLFKVGAAPLHPWAPDVYEAAPMPVVAFFSVVPKLAGVGILTKFIFVINLFGQSAYDWQTILAIVAMLTLTVGNFSALWQKNPKRLMAYSSIAQSGFLLVGVVAFLPTGVQFMLFYASVYLFMNFLVFMYLQYFEQQGMETIAAFSGAGKTFAWPSVFILIGFVALTGLPPTSGFTAKLFVFSALWESFQFSNKSILLWLLIFGLLNTVVSLFYYLRIPYFSFVKDGENHRKPNFITLENLFGFILVLVVLILFFSPGLLMGWINKINFVL